MAEVDGLQQQVLDGSDRSRRSKVTASETVGVG